MLRPNLQMEGGVSWLEVGLVLLFAGLLVLVLVLR